MDSRVDVGNAGREAGLSDTPIGEELYQLFLKKHQELANDWQENCPDLDELRKFRISDNRISLERLGITRKDLDSLSCIHVAGTKGKGSTCAMTERILRTYGYKTGIISSPPLLEIRERVRINGAPVSRAMYGRYGVECLELLEKNKTKFGHIFTPVTGPYSMFTFIAYYILVKEKVDVAVVEVGLGGEYDSTNVLWSPTVTGVSSLAVEHVSQLGDTLAKISWHKSGIFKDGRPALTAPQREEAMTVLVQRAKERNAPLRVCPPLGDYECNGVSVKLGLAGKHQRINAALAVQLTKTWLDEKAPGRVQFQGPQDVDISGNSTIGDKLDDGKVQRATPFVLPDEFLQGFELSKWPGRNQIIRKTGVTYYIDIAHTKNSVAFCKNWFEEEASNEAKMIPGVIKKVLIFNLGGDRDGYTILRPLVEYGFDAVVFSVMRTVASQENEVRDYKTIQLLDDQLMKCHQHLATFKKLHGDICDSFQDQPCHRDVMQAPIFKVTPSATEAIQWVLDSRMCLDDRESMDLPDGEGFLHKADHLQVLVTGSNFLAGSVIHVIEPNMFDKVEY
ncbi:folylpolyglutamate synthase, mitochondrial [Strongylocentrotus purpuratus]|uniref:tetrahydrofolate synthase n=1 Tax=Strongylocentrotus purpuratus TaxID=7668 RepID=A0A7M7SSU5_STRPU|nr:folylpolyglutamate synthase, mitochondrial [Strongylocentrotus purpuratus]